jgi:hypothetical protein
VIPSKISGLKYVSLTTPVQEYEMKVSLLCNTLSISSSNGEKSSGRFPSSSSPLFSCIANAISYFPTFSVISFGTLKSIPSNSQDTISPDESLKNNIKS